MTAANAKVIGKIILQGNVRLETPLQIGSGATDNFTDSLVLKNKQGKPYIPGTSLAGVLRALNKADEVYFGDMDTMQSTIVTSDIELNKAKLVIRDSVAIDLVRGVGMDGAKFDYELVERGAEGKFKIVATVRQCQQDEFTAIKACMKNIGEAMLQGIFMGAKTTNGLGKVKAVPGTVQLQVFDFRDYAAVKAWLQKQDAPVKKLLKAEAIANPQDFIIEACFALKSSLLVRSDDLTGYDAQDINGAVQMKSRNDYLIPGATMKGVIRNQAYNICRTLGKADKATIAMLNDIFGFANDGDNSAGKKGKLIAEEVYIKENVHAHAQSRNRIDRFTGATIDGALMTNIPVWQDKAEAASVELRLTLKNYEPWQAGLLLFVLKDLWTGQVAVGGEKAIGRGTLQGINGELYFADQHVSIRDYGGFAVDNAAALEKFAKAFVDYVGGGRDNE